jgi:hypothetical protein
LAGGRLQEPVDFLFDLAIAACVAFGQACASSRSSRIGASKSTVQQRRQAAIRLR